MTATYPTRQQARECRLYRFYVTHPVTGQVVLGYVGETGRLPFERLLEHLATQPWFDTVVRWEVDPRVFHGKQAVLDAESAAIRAEQPLYNVKGNERNQRRIPPPTAIRQRRARDAAKRGPRWVHPDDRGPRTQPVRSTTRRARPAWKSWQKAMIWWPGTWLGTTLTGWTVALVKHLGGARDALVGSAFLLPLAVTVFAVLLSACATKRTRRQVWRALLGLRR